MPDCILTRVPHVTARASKKRSANLRPVSTMYADGGHLLHDRQLTTLSVMQEKMNSDVSMPSLGVVIVDDELIWGHVQRTVLLQGKVPGDWSGRFGARLLLTSRSFIVLARVKAFSGGLLKILLVVLSSRRTWKFLEMIFTATRFLGWKVVPTGTLSLAVLIAAPLFKISALDVADARSLPLLMRSLG